MLHSELQDCHIVTMTIRSASRGSGGKPRDTVIFGDSHDVATKRYIVRDGPPTRSGTLLMRGGATILCRIH